MILPSSILCNMAQKKTTQPFPVLPTRPKDHPVNWLHNPRWQAALLFGFAFLLYANTLGHGFALDDAIVLTDNFLVKKGPSGWGELFSHDTFYGFFQDEGKAKLVSGGRYRPLTLAFFSLERSLSQGPFIYHFFNLLWYGLCVLLLFGLLRSMVAPQSASFDRLQQPSEQPLFWLPFLAAAFFAAHPVHTEVVANIKGRDEIMALAASLGAAWLLWTAVAQRKWAAAFLAAAVFFLALLAKENAITFLAVFCLVLLFFRQDFQWVQLRFAAPLLGSALLFLVIRQRILGGTSSSGLPELMNNPFLKLENGRWVDFSFAEWSATVVYGLGEYLRLLLFPLRLNHDYYPRAFDIMQWSNALVLFAAAAQLGLLLLAFWQFKKQPWLSFSILVYFATLSIVSNVFFPVGTLLSERFLFMPSFAWAILLAWGLLQLGSRFGKQPANRNSGNTDQQQDNGSRRGTGVVERKTNLALPSKAIASRQLPLGLWAVVGGILLLYSLRTISRNPVWQDNYTLFTTDATRQPNSAKLQNAAAGAKVDRYQSLSVAAQSKQRQLLEEAVQHLNKALQIHPTYKNAFLLRGNAKVLLEQYEAAVADYDAALTLDPGYRDAQLNQAIALRQLGRFYGEKQGDLAKAKQYLERSYSLRTDDPETLRLLGVLNGNLGQITAAINYFTQAAQLEPTNADLWWFVGLAQAQAGDLAAAEQSFQRARQLEPGIEARKASGG